MLFAQIFLDNLLPIFLTAGAGFALGRLWSPDLKTISRLVFYIFSPCLVFTSLLHAPISGGEFTQMALFTVGVVGASVALAALAGWGLLRLPRRQLLAFIIAVAFVNGGNYGLPLVQFAFGEAALAHGVVFLVVSTLCVYTLGVGLASLGRSSGWQLARTALTLPANYGVVAAGLLRWNHWPLPLAVDRAVELLGQAALPIMLVLLGLQVAASIKPGPDLPGQFKSVGAAVALRLIGGPVLAWGLSQLLGLSGPLRQAALIEAAMPTTVITTILALEYELDAALINQIVIVSTLLSPLTLTPLIAYLQGH